MPVLSLSQLAQGRLKIGYKEQDLIATICSPQRRRVPRGSQRFSASLGVLCASVVKRDSRYAVSFPCLVEGQIEGMLDAEARQKVDILQQVHYEAGGFSQQVGVDVLHGVSRRVDAG